MNSNEKPLRSKEDLILSDKERNSVIVNIYTYHSSADRQGLLAVSDQLEDLLRIRLSELGANPKNSIHFKGFSSSQIDSFEHFYFKKSGAIAGAEDTMLMQVGLSSDQAVADGGWAALKRFLHGLLKDFIQDFNTRFPMVYLLGISTIYKANLAHGGSFNLHKEILNAAQPVFGTLEQLYLSRAIHSSANGGVYFLGGQPLEQKVSNLVYIVLCKTGEQDALMAQDFFFNNNRRLSVDALVHKATYQWLQFGSSETLKYNKKLSNLSQKTLNLLRNKIGSVDPRSLNVMINEIGEVLHDLLSPLDKYREMELSIKKQKENLQIKITHDQLMGLPKDEINIYHLNTIINQLEDCNLTMQRVDIVIEHAKTAISLIDARVGKQSAEFGFKIQLYLAVFGTALAFIQVFDAEVAKAFMGTIGVEADSSGLLIFSIRVVIGIIICFFVYKTVQRHSRN